MRKTTLWLLTICIAALVIGSYFTIETMQGKNESMREDLLTNVKIAATAINVSDIKALSGSADDLNSSHYQNLKELMVAQLAALPEARFVYLLGQMDNGTIFFFIDSEPADSPDNSPPGQIYDVPSVTIDRAFDGELVTGGPQTDSWGVWMSGMVPIIDPNTGKIIAVLGIDISATHWADRELEAGMVPALTTLLIVTLVIIFFIIQRRKEEENRKLSEAAKALRESSDKYRTLIENSQDAIFIFQEGKLVFVSPPIKKIIGYTPEELTSRPILDFVAPQDHKRMAELTQLLTDSTGIVRLERVRLLQKNSSAEALVSLSVSRIDYNGRPAIMGTSHDLTAMERAEMALTEANRKLQLMTGITRHDILNQITVLRGYLELMKMTNDPVKSRSLEEKAKEAASNIKDIIAFTKDYQEIGMTAPVWHPLPSLVQRSTPPAMDGVKLLDHLPKVEILADPLIVKVFYNLIDNAVRHGQRTTKIEFTARVEEGSLLIEVQDDGVGVSDQEKKLIFERGYGKHTGLGLFFCRDVLSITEIEIDENGESGQGARFVLKVPSGKWRPID